ncbi:MAG: Dyp-type peroxidase [Acidimicrobiia bacterium]|nr:Dyp-type peroxidase [Acidimicrobiia bacterium]
MRSGPGPRTPCRSTGSSCSSPSATACSPASPERESPAGARSFTGVVGPHGRSAVATQHDLLVWVHGDRHDLNFDAALATRRVLSDVACLVEETAGFVYRDCRDLTGFVDGTENPPAEEARELVILPEGAPGAGGSYVLVQRWVHDLDAFHALPTAEQERVIGRTKPDSVELDDLPPDSHVGRVVVEDEAGEEIEIYRRSVPYGTAAEAGLLFLAFTDDLDKFELILSRMFGTSGDGFHDRLTELSAAVSGGYYFAPAQEALDGWLS